MNVGDEEENAAELQFGAEFVSDVQYLTNDEVYFLLLNRSLGNVQTTDAFQQTLNYLGKIATTKKVDDLASMATELGTKLQNLELELRGSRKRVKLHPFEISNLANLIKMDETAPVEVVSWIPSLSRFDDEEIKKAVDVVVEAKERFYESLPSRPPDESKDGLMSHFCSLVSYCMDDFVETLKLAVN